MDVCLQYQFKSFTNYFCYFDDYHRNLSEYLLIFLSFLSMGFLVYQFFAASTKKRQIAMQAEGESEEAARTYSRLSIYILTAV